MSDESKDGFGLREPKKKPLDVEDLLDDFVKTGQVEPDSSGKSSASSPESAASSAHADPADASPSTTPEEKDEPADASPDSEPLKAAGDDDPALRSYVDGTVRRRFNAHIDVRLFQQLSVFAALHNISKREALERLLREALSAHENLP